MKINVQFIHPSVLTIIGTMIGMNIVVISKLLTKIDPPFDVEGAPRCIVG